ncbi:MAG: Fpg/Nei family DNA glycosylase [Candidatus Altiarchaeales archaeon]|nr:Fpg/Nei family DNA glycosylase [Candidatus Altiarchaeales archaeon]MBD3416884.1 Fpg/Nei family DNA glycosylase [Candidatus Altiarchaeales archaeon]
MNDRLPELPEVEVFKRYLSRTGLKKEIKGFSVDEERILKKSISTFRRHLKGNKLTGTGRHGKYLFAPISGGHELVFHFGMTGYLAYFKEEEPEHSRAVIRFPQGRNLTYVSQRMLGHLDITKDRERFIADKHLGPDALDIGLGEFKERLSNRRGHLKTALMNQELIAGIGNIYSDEILFHAGLHPKTSAKKLDDTQIGILHRKMRKVLDKAIEKHADENEMPESYLLPHRSKGEECPNDGSKLKTVKVNQRTAYYCPKHQKR